MPIHWSIASTGSVVALIMCGELATSHALAQFKSLGTNLLSVSFENKSQADAGWINGGFFVFEPEVFRYLTDDESVLEQAPLERLATEGQLMAYKHAGFWQCMDTARDRDYLNELAERGLVPWKPAE